MGVGRSQDEALNPPRAWSGPYGLELTVTFQMPGTITRLESPSHPLSFALDGTQATVTLAQARAALDRDVVVPRGGRWTLGAPRASSSGM